MIVWVGAKIELKLVSFQSLMFVAFYTKIPLFPLNSVILVRFATFGREMLFRKRETYTIGI